MRSVRRCGHHRHLCLLWETLKMKNFRRPSLCPSSRTLDADLRMAFWASLAAAYASAPWVADGHTSLAREVSELAGACPSPWTNEGEPWSFEGVTMSDNFSSEDSDASSFHTPLAAVASDGEASSPNTGEVPEGVAIFDIADQDTDDEKVLEDPEDRDINTDDQLAMLDQWYLVDESSTIERFPLQQVSDMSGDKDEWTLLEERDVFDDWRLENCEDVGEPLGEDWETIDWAPGEGNDLFVADDDATESLD